MAGRSHAVAALIILVIVIAGLAILLGRGGGQQAQAPTGECTVRAATLQGGISTLDIIESEHLLEARGCSLQVLRLQKTPNILEAIAKNDTDLAVIPAEMAAKLIMKGVPVRIVAVDMLQNQAILARNASIRSPEDLEGKTVGAVVASGTYKLFKAYMKIVYNLTVVEGQKPSPGVVTAVNVPPGSILDALEQGQVDAVVIWEPFVSLGLSRGLHVVANFTDLWEKSGARGEPVMLVWVAREDFVKHNKEALDRFLSARSEAAHIWNTEPSKVYDVLSSLYKLPPDAQHILYNRTVIVEGNLTSTLIESIRSEWWLAWKGGYLPESPDTIGDSVFYQP